MMLTHRFNHRIRFHKRRILESALTTVDLLRESDDAICCGLCGSRVRQFQPHGLEHPVLSRLDVVGGGHRVAARCPVCLGNDRDRLVYGYLHFELGVFNRRCRVLHVAPEKPIEQLFRASSDIEYLTGDLQAPDVMVHLNLCSLKFDDDSFDLVIANHVLEHIPDDRRAMREICRILRPGGVAILQTPISMSLDATFEDETITTPSDRERVFGQFDHVRVYGRDYLERLQQSGFDVELFDWRTSTRIPRDWGVLNHLNPREYLYVSRKPLS